MTEKKTGKMDVPASEDKDKAIKAYQDSLMVGESLNPTQAKPVANFWLITVALAAVIILAVVIFVFRPDSSVVVVSAVEGEAAASLAVNKGEIIDVAATPGVLPRVGYRYRLVVEDETDDGSAGVARIGGMMTFIQEARCGQTVVVEMTRVRPRAADAMLLRVEDATTRPVVKRDRPVRAPVKPYVPGEEPVLDPAVADSEAIQVGELYRLRVDEDSKKNPGREGIAHIDGLVVVVAGARQGDVGVARIVDRRERMAFAQMVLVEKAGEATPVSTEVKEASVSQPDDVVMGALFRLTITEDSRKNPGLEGIANVGGLVVVVSGAKVGEVVTARIVGRQERVAFAKIVASGGTAAPQVSSDVKDGAVSSPDEVLTGALFRLTVAEDSKKNPGMEGIARVGGLVVVVEGGKVGDVVTARIVGRQERVAFAEVVSHDGIAATPPVAPPVRPGPPPVVSDEILDGAASDSALVLPGAKFRVTIANPSKKNPETEGVANIGGLVVIVTGGRQGEVVVIRITDRKDRMAFAEIILREEG